MPKQVFLVEYSHLNDFLVNLIKSEQYPDVATLSLERLQEEFKKNPINPNEILVNYLLPKRKEYFWLSPGKEAVTKTEELLSTLEEEDFL